VRCRRENRRTFALKCISAAYLTASHIRLLLGAFGHRKATLDSSRPTQGRACAFPLRSTAASSVFFTSRNGIPQIGRSGAQSSLLAFSSSVGTMSSTVLTIFQPQKNCRRHMSSEAAKGRRTAQRYEVMGRQGKKRCATWSAETPAQCLFDPNTHPPAEHRASALSFSLSISLRTQTMDPPARAPLCNSLSLFLSLSRPVRMP